MSGILENELKICQCVKRVCRSCLPVYLADEINADNLQIDIIN